MKVSNCCGARGDYKSEYYDPTFQQVELCPKCGEHCEYIEETDTTEELIHCIEQLKCRIVITNTWDKIAVLEAERILKKHHKHRTR